MKGFRISDIEGMKVRVPSPVNIAELVSAREFHGQLIHFTEDQWKSTLEQLDPLERIPKEAIGLRVTRLPSGGGFLGEMPPECPADDCDDGASRKEAFTDLVELENLPDKSFWFRPMCYCVEDEDEDLVDTEPVDPPLVGRCDFRLIPLRINLGGQIRTLMLFQCIAVDDRCRRCQLGVSMSSSGTYSIGCQCPLL